MPDHKSLRPGHRIRLLCVPERDLQQRDRELSSGCRDAGWTANTLERIIALDPVVTIAYIDEYELPWFEYELTGEDGEVEYHSIAIVDDDSWEFAE